jgi:PAS domain S-box-containing protein
MDNAQLIGVMLDAEGKILFANPFLLRLAGWSSEEVLGKDWFGLFVPPDQSRDVKQVYDSLIQNTRAPRYENEIITHRGERRQVAWNNLAMKDAASRIIGVASIGEDVTERKQLKGQLRQAQKMEVVGQLAGGVAHDFNNIIAATLMHLGLLQGNPNISPATKESLRELEEETMRAAGLMRQLLLFSRRQVARVEPLDLNELINGLLKMLRRLLGANIEVKFQPSSEAAWVCADAGMLEQVVLNLCINARDAMPKGGRLTLAATMVEPEARSAQAHPDARPGRFVCMSVTETGCGMDKTVLAKLFELLFTTKEAGKGIGLGLATICGIIKQHEGWTEVDSKVGQGSTFRVYLPVQAKPVSAPGTPNPEEIKGGSETILLVEDEPSVRRTVALCLRKLGYAVLKAGTALEALKAWEEHHQAIKLLFTDLVLPEEMTGLDLGERLRKEKASLKVVISSGYSEDPATPPLTTGQEITYLAKPYKATALAKAVRRCLDQA